MSKKLVYVASPVKAVYDLVFNENDANFVIKNLAIAGCKRVKKAGFTPVSPVLMFNEIYDENTERDRIIQACEEVLKKCDEIMVVSSSYNEYSKGIKYEIEFANKLGITQVEY